MPLQNLTLRLLPFSFEKSDLSLALHSYQTGKYQEKKNLLHDKYFVPNLGFFFDVLFVMIVKSTLDFSHSHLHASALRKVAFEFYGDHDTWIGLVPASI